VVARARVEGEEVPIRPAPMRLVARGASIGVASGGESAAAR
jgi:hypothetical protein